MPAILKVLRDSLADTPTGNGTTVYQIADAAKVNDEEVLRPLDTSLPRVPSSSRPLSVPR